MNTHERITDASPGTPNARHDLVERHTTAPDRGALIHEEAARRANATTPRATITTHLEAGEPAATIVQASRGDALIVVGRGRARRPGGRSVERTLVRLADCPISVIRIPAASKPNGARR